MPRSVDCLSHYCLSLLNVEAKTLQELIKVRGWQVSPTEIEACLLQHPHIIDAAVIGVGFPDVQVELPRAYVVVDPKSSSPPLSDEEVHVHVGNHLAKYKALTGGIRRISSIPKSAAGKILKKVLREVAAKEAAEQENLKHVEQPIPVDKTYFEHVEHVEVVEHGPGVVAEEISNGTANVGGSGNPKKTSNGNIVIVGGLDGFGDVKKRKHAMNGNDANDYTNGTVANHKRTKSHTNGVDGNAENRTRRSLRMNGEDGA